jgi:hypothetical protein
MDSIFYFATGAVAAAAWLVVWLYRQTRQSCRHCRWWEPHHCGGSEKNRWEKGDPRANEKSENPQERTLNK